MYGLIVLDNLRYINQNNIVATIDFNVTYQNNIIITMYSGTDVPYLVPTLYHRYYYRRESNEIPVLII